MSGTETQIRERIDSFVKELDALVRQSALESLQDALGSRVGTLTPVPRRGRGRPPKAAGKRRGRPAKDVSGVAQAIVGYVKANDGSGVSTIAAGVGADLATAKRAVAQLLASGELKKTGQKRGTKYHAGGGKAPRASKKTRKAKGRGKAKKAA